MNDRATFTKMEASTAQDWQKIGEEFRRHRGGAQDIGHQGAASRPQLHQSRILRTALVGPSLHQP